MSVTKTLGTNGQLKLKSITEDVTFDVPSGKNVVLPSRTDFSACATALNAEVDLSSKQNSHAYLTQISAFNPEHGDFMRYFDSGGDEYWHLRTSGDVLNDINAQARHARLTELSGLSGLSSGDIVHWDGSNLVASSKSSLSIQPLATALTQIAAISNPSTGQVIKYNGSAWAAGSDDGEALTFSAPLSESGGTVSLDVSGLVQTSGNQTVAGNKTLTGTTSVESVFQHRVDANSGYITSKRDRLFKLSFNDTDPHSLFGDIYYSSDRECIVDVEITAIDVTSNPKRMHVHKLSCVTLGGSVINSQSEIVYQPASGEVLSSAFAFALSGNALSCTVTQPSTKSYNYNVFVVDRAVLTA